MSKTDSKAAEERAYIEEKLVPELEKCLRLLKKGGPCIVEVGVEHSRSVSEVPLVSVRYTRYDLNRL